MNATVAFLHTSPVHVATFDQLLAEIAPNAKAHHIVNEEFLAEARAKGDNDALRTHVVETLTQAGEEAVVVICTCSTIGGYAGQANARSASAIFRVDQPMADAAVQAGERILIAAALANTMEPTRALLQDAAHRLGKSVTLIDIFCEDAWQHFEAGDLPAYHESIAQTLRGAVEQGDVIVLAQASMAPSAALCSDLELPILSSPRLAVQRAVALLNNASD